MHVLRSLAVGGLILLAIGALSLLALHFKSAKLLSVQTASMVPTFRPHDALIVVKDLHLRPGEIVSYHSPRNPNLVITHRLVKIDRQTGWLTTQGDAYKRPDPSFPPNLVEGRATLLLPHLGSILDALHKPLGLAAAIYIPALIVLVSEVHHLAAAYTRPLYSARL